MHPPSDTNATQKVCRILGDATSKRYALGDAAVLLGIAMQRRDQIRERARSSLERLAALSGDTLLLSTRHGLESVCVDREFGSFPIRANYLDLDLDLDIDIRRPLGAGAGSLALTASRWRLSAWRRCRSAKPHEPARPPERPQYSAMQSMALA